MPCILHKYEQEDHEEDTGGLLNKLACRGKFCALHAEAVAADTAVDSRARQGVGDDKQHFGASGISQKCFSNMTGILLDQQNFS